MPRGEALDAARGVFREVVPEATAVDEDGTRGVFGFCRALEAATDAALRAIELFCQDGEDPMLGMGRILESMRCHAIAQETLFGLRRALPPVDRFFLDERRREEAGRFERTQASSQAASAGLFHARNGRDARGGFSLWIPEDSANAPFPLLVVLHGGSGHGADFLWTWLREGRSRHCAILSPTARGGTWSFQGPDVDAAALPAMIDWACERWPIDR